MILYITIQFRPKIIDKRIIIKIVFILSGFEVKTSDFSDFKVGNLGVRSWTFRSSKLDFSEFKVGLFRVRSWIFGVQSWTFLSSKLDFSDFGSDVSDLKV
jgi:hypothetical protein